MSMEAKVNSMRFYSVHDSRMGPRVRVRRSSLAVAIALVIGAARAEASTLDTPLCPTSPFFSETGCFPTDCTSTAFLDWGVGTPENILIPKFDPALGTLTGVELVLSARHEGTICIDNSSAACNLIQVTPQLLAFFEATPALPGVGVLLAQFGEDLLPLGFFLGPADGIFDCPLSKGPSADGTCSGGDQFNKVWDEVLSIPATVLTGSTQLAPWINTPSSPQEFVTFAGSAISIITASGGTGFVVVTSSAGSVSITAKYIYCPEQPVVTAYCFGDGTQGACPCGATGAAGQGCPNTNPNDNGAELKSIGSPEVGNDNFGLVITDGAFNKPGIIIQGASSLNHPNGNGDVPNASGLFCVSPQQRGSVFFTNGAGGTAVTDFQGAPFGASAQPCGSTTYYQYWFRDPSNICQNAPGTSAAFNFSNALAVDWIP
ncbi:MAG: hypothetical protein ACI8X5_002797 [Planctomycetota bacterium]|jgi:hypothetical protein